MELHLRIGLQNPARPRVILGVAACDDDTYTRSQVDSHIVAGDNSSTLNLAMRLDCYFSAKNTCLFAGTFRADDGTRTHDLLHGNPPGHA